MSDHATTKALGVRPIEGIPDFLLQVEPGIRKALDAQRATYIYADLPGIANRLTDEQTLHARAQEATARQLSNVVDLSVDLLSSEQTTRRLSDLQQQIAQREEAAEEGAEQAGPNANAPIPNIGGIANIRLPAGYNTYRQQQIFAYDLVQVVVSKIDPEMLFYISISEPDCGTAAVRLLYRQYAPRTDVMADIIDQAFEGLLQSFSAKDHPEQFFKALLRLQHIRAYIRDSDQLDAHAAIDRLIARIASVYRVESTLYQSLSRFKTAARDQERVIQVASILRDYALQNAETFEDRGRGQGFFDTFKRLLMPRPASTGAALHKALAAAEDKTACTFCATILGKIFTNHTYAECRNRVNPDLLARLVREGKLTEAGGPGPNAGKKNTTGTGGTGGEKGISQSSLLLPLRRGLP